MQCHEVIEVGYQILDKLQFTVLLFVGFEGV